MNKPLSVCGRMGPCRTPSVARFLCVAHTPRTGWQRLYAHGTTVPWTLSQVLRFTRRYRGKPNICVTGGNKV